MTHREARRTLGSRTSRRANTNGKTILGASTKKGRAKKLRNPRGVSRRNIIAVRALVRGAA